MIDPSPHVPSSVKFLHQLGPSPFDGFQASMLIALLRIARAALVDVCCEMIELSRMENRARPNRSVHGPAVDAKSRPRTGFYKRCPPSDRTIRDWGRSLLRIYPKTLFRGVGCQPARGFRIGS